MRGIGAAKTILPPRWGSLFYRIQRGLIPPPMLYRPYRANHDSAFYITGVPPPPMLCRPYRANHYTTFYITGANAPAYAVSPLQGLFLIAQEIADQVRNEEGKSGISGGKSRISGARLQGGNQGRNENPSLVSSME